MTVADSTVPKVSTKEVTPGIKQERDGTLVNVFKNVWMEVNKKSIHTYISLCVYKERLPNHCTLQ